METHSTFVSESKVQQQSLSKKLSDHEKSHPEHDKESKSKKQDHDSYYHRAERWLHKAAHEIAEYDRKERIKLQRDEIVNMISQQRYGMHG